MKHNYLLLLGFCILLLSPVVLTHGDHDHDHDEEEAEDPNVIVLTKDNFDQVLKDNEFVFAEFYAPWCGHCKRLAPEWSKLAVKVKEGGHNIAIAKLDATQAEEVAQKHGIRGYPTLKFFRSGQAVDYEGGRTLDEMYQFAVRKAGPASRHLSTQEEIDSFLAGPGTKLVAYLNSAEEEDKSYSNWIKAATSGSLEEFSVAHVTDSKLFGDNKADTFVIHKDGETIPFTDKFVKSQIVSFVESEGFPLVEELAQKIWQRSQGGPTPLLAGFVQQDNEEQMNLIKDLAKKFKGKVLFSQSTQSALAERWGSSGKVFPTAILVQWVNGDPKMTIYDEESGAFTLESGEAFINEALEGKYKSYKKSEPVPEKNDDAVKVVVGKSFEQIVLDKSKDVFVEFYAPWCGHCKKLAPIWDELGEVFEGDDNIVIAKMDATTNSAPDNIAIKGFPTLIFFPADNKEGVPYSGERDLDNLVKFVKEKASHSVGGDKVDL